MADSGNEKCKIYWYPMFRSARVVWLIKELGVEGDFEFIKYKRNDDPAADVGYQRDTHPHGTVPALVVPGEQPLIESGGMCLYLAHKYGKFGPGENPKDYFDFITYGVATLDEVLVFFYYYWLVGMKCPDEKVAAMRKKSDTCMTYLTKRLTGRKWLCGNEFTAADVVVGYDVFLGKALRDGELIANYPVVKEYFARLEERPAFKAAINMT